MPSPIIGRPRRPPYEPPRYRPRRSRFLLVGLPMFAVFAAFASIVWLAYVDGAPGSAMGEPPLIKADASPLRLSPDDPGGRVVADQGEVRELFRDEPVAQPELLLPPPEEPITALVEAEPEPPAEQDAAAAAGEAPVLAGPDVTVAARESEPPAEEDLVAATAEIAGAAIQASREQAGDPVPVRQEAASDGGDDGIQAADDPEAALDALLAEVTGTRTEREERPQPAQAAEEPASAEAEPAPAQQATADVRPAVAVPVPQRSEAGETRPARADREPEIAAIAPGEPVQQPQAPIRTERPAQAAAPPARDQGPAVQPAPSQGASGGQNYRIQLAAVREETDARRAWDLFQLDLGDVLTGVDPIIERAETANGIFYRVQVGPFTNLASAETLCDRLKQRNASCFVIRR